MEWNKDRITGLVGFLFGLCLLIAALKIPSPPTATSDFMGPAAFPIIVSVMVILCSIGIFSSMKNLYLTILVFKIFFKC
ncbi:hypothetical protein H1D32_24245 [Anaerobacillus sp. CMMVII]|uniref:hypothetical protein n=1 Tax=Anaerobacillus sp. CMMVII TaxID=2755588 RepID=UPI0021B7590E|nr:hypothetical protein [Anaerobacillus sp. CMMVII]MCT8140509.1 hypothetical protein [Anaerobacillus sp. CMMVII]